MQFQLQIKSTGRLNFTTFLQLGLKFDMIQATSTGGVPFKGKHISRLYN
jgi:hypothetical protein